MVFYVDCIEINDFNGFNGCVSVGPFEKFTFLYAATGAASGKDLLDAFSFVFGEQALDSFHLDSFEEFINIPETGSPIADQASVRITFKNDDDNLRRVFQRTVLRTGSDRYMCDNEEVEYQEYIANLEAVFIRKNFGVMMCEKDIIEMRGMDEHGFRNILERFSESHILKVNYEERKDGLTKMKELIRLQQSKLHAVSGKLRLNEKSQQLPSATLHNTPEMIALKTELHLFNLYHCEKSIEKHETSTNQLKATVDGLLLQKGPLVDYLDDALAKLREAHTLRLQLESSLIDLKVVFSKKQLRITKLKQLSEDMQRKVTESRENLLGAEETHSASQLRITMLEREKADFESKLEAIERDHPSIGDNPLDPEQKNAYIPLKVERHIRCAHLMPRLERLQYELVVAIAAHEMELLRLRARASSSQMQSTRTPGASTEDARQKATGSVAALEPRDTDAIAAEIHDVTEQLNEMEDQIFRPFCVRFGYEDIRKFENQHSLVTFEEQDKRYGERRNLFEKICNVNTEIRRERIKGFIEKISKLNRDIAQYGRVCAEAEEKLHDEQSLLAPNKGNLEKADAEAKKVNSDYDATKHHLDESKEKLTSLCKEIDEAVRRYDKAVVNLRGEISRRHQILSVSKIDGVQLPLIRGTLEEVFSDDDDDDDEDEKPLLYDVELDYSSLKRKHKLLDSAEEVMKFADSLKKKISKYSESVGGKKGHFDKTFSEGMAKLKAKRMQLRTQLKQQGGDLALMNAEFHTVRDERCRRFRSVFDGLPELVDKYYRELNNNQNARASMATWNEEEPYLNGIHLLFAALEYRTLDTIGGLCGDEQINAMISLIFAMNRCSASPFIILEESEPHFGLSNIIHLVKFFRNRIGDAVQCIIVSENGQSIASHADVVFAISPKRTLSFCPAEYDSELTTSHR